MPTSDLARRLHLSICNWTYSTAPSFWMDGTLWLLSYHSCWPIRWFWKSTWADESSVSALTPVWSRAQGKALMILPMALRNNLYLEAVPTVLGMFGLAQILHLLNTLICSNLFSKLQLGLMYTQEMWKSQKKESWVQYLPAKVHCVSRERKQPWERNCTREICSLSS